MIAALPLSEGGEEAQLKRIAELQVQDFIISMKTTETLKVVLLIFFSCFELYLQAENDFVGQELQKQLEAAGNNTFLPFLSFGLFMNISLILSVWWLDFVYLCTPSYSLSQIGKNTRFNRCNNEVVQWIE